MKVRDLMTREVECCEPGTDLAAATEMMWRADCGVLPVMSGGTLAGMITDRDICMALGTQNRAAAEVSVGEVASRDVQVCAPDADVHSAMAVMRKAQVRRLPVVEDGRLLGILSLNDIVDAVDRKHGDLDYEEVMNTMKAICEHHNRKPAAAVTNAGSKRKAAIA